MARLLWPHMAQQGVVMYVSMSFFSFYALYKCEDLAISALSESLYGLLCISICFFFPARLGYVLSQTAPWRSRWKLSGAPFLKAAEIEQYGETDKTLRCRSVNLYAIKTSSPPPVWQCYSEGATPLRCRGQTRAATGAYSTTKWSQELLRKMSTCHSES